MKKSLFEQMGGIYTQQGDYVLPNLILPAENQPIGIWGQRHARHLKQYHKILYYNLLTSRKLDSYSQKNPKDWLGLRKIYRRRFGIQQ